MRNSANNCWNVNLNNGNVNNNNTYNRYFVVGASESFPNCDGWHAAELSFYQNKHDSPGAQRIHLHPGRVARMARLVAARSYHPQPGYCFPLRTPTPREIYAAFCQDRLVHHYVAPFIAEVAELTHNANGNISHGNRIEHSAQTGAEQIRDALLEAMAEYAEPYVVKVDIRSFFSSIPRERAYEALARYADAYYMKPDKAEMLALCKVLILHDPVAGCVELPGNWDSVVPAKRLKNAKEGHGLPIGNFYSQLVANLYLAQLDAQLAVYGKAPRFVDDKVAIVKDKDAARAFIRAARAAAEDLGLVLHPDKIYIQPVRHGVNFCGRTIKGRRVYLSNKTIGRCLYRLRNTPASLQGARKVCGSVNSYIGLLTHCTEYKAQRALCDKVLRRFGGWLYFVERGGKFTCKIKKRYATRTERRTVITNLMTTYAENSHRPSTSRPRLLRSGDGRHRGPLRLLRSSSPGVGSAGRPFRGYREGGL